MTTEYSISIDWQEEYKNNPDRWINHGRQALENACTHYTRDKDKDGETNMRYGGWCEECGVGEDDAMPMMNYAYPLYCDPSEEDILKVVQQTCLTVMENNDTGEFFLVLCGGGMDLSQDIGLAYLLTDKRIPFALAMAICTQPNMTINGKEFRRVMRACKEEIESEMHWGKERLEKTEKAIKASLEMDKKKTEGE